MGSDRAFAADRRSRHEAGRRPPGAERDRPCPQERRPLGGLRRRLRAEEDALQPLRALGRARRLGGHLQRARQRRRGRSMVHRFQLHQGSSLRRGRKGGGLVHGIGRTKGGRNTKLHAVCDSRGRPLVLVLTPGNTHDCKVARACIEALPPSAELVADKGYDSGPLREWLEARGTTPVIPPRRYRKVQYAYDRAVYRQRNIIERMVCRLKDWRRIATRYARKLKSIVSPVAHAAAVTRRP